MKILFLTPRFPFPIIGGDRLKPNYILSHLAKSHEVTLVTFYQGGEPPKSFARSIENMGVELFTVPLNPVKAGLRCFSRLFTKYPLEILFYQQPKFASVVNKLTAERNFDLGFAFFMRTAEYLRNKPMKKILMAEDCRTLYQRRSYEKSVNLKQKLVRYWEYRKLRNYEPDIVNYFDVTTLVTEQDIDSMRQQNSNANYKLLTNGVDINKFTPAEDFRSRKGMIFSGKLDIWANYLMLQIIANDIFPKVKKQLPDVILDIIGSNPTNAIRSLAKNNKDISIISDVPEMHPYLQKAALFIHPHNGGSGIQNKLLEAMACGCPVVTTPTGNQGIDAKNGKEVLIGNTSDELAAHAVKLLKDRDFAYNISKNARFLIERTHSWFVVFDAVDNIIFELFE